MLPKLPATNISAALRGSADGKTIAGFFVKALGLSQLLDNALVEYGHAVAHGQGLALVMGLTPALIPGVFAQTPDLIRPILESPLAVGTFSAMVLVMGFRFGEVQEQKMTLELLQTRNESLQAYQVNRQLEPPLIALGEQAGAAKEQIDRVVNLGSEFIAVLAQAEGMPAVLNVVARVQAQQVHLSLELTPPGLPGERTWQQQYEAHLKSWAQDHCAQLRISPRGNQMSLVLIFE